MAITNVQWNGWCYKTTSPSGHYRAICLTTPHFLWTSMYTLQGGESGCTSPSPNNLTQSLALYTENWATNPDTGNPWTLASIFDCFWGVALWKSLTGTSRCDQMWLTVSQDETPTQFNLLPISQGGGSPTVEDDPDLTAWQQARYKDGDDVWYTQAGGFCPEREGHYFFRVGSPTRTRAYIID